jgi:methylmalonyl-CoA/ethylmalonyl-CoA epimerase
MTSPTAVLDHVAIGTPALTDGWKLFGGLLGGSWVYGGDSPGFWWGQLQFRSGPKVELLTPTTGPDSAFLERFLTSRGPGPHHLNFIVQDIGGTLARVRALGIVPVGVRLQSDHWKEAFLHPKDAHGIVIQVAQQSGPPPQLAPPADFPGPGQSSDFALVELRVSDIARATRLFEAALGGEVTSQQDADSAAATELTWPNGARLRLVRPLAAAGPLADGLAHLQFGRSGQPFGQAEVSRAAELAARLGVCLQLTP